VRPPPRAVRRLLDPLRVLLILVVAVLLGLVLICSAVVAPLTPRRRVLRVATFGLVYCCLDIALVAACTWLWLLKPRRRTPEDAAAWTAAHCGLLTWALGTLISVSGPTVGFRVTVDPDAEAIHDDRRPVVVLARHAGPGDSFTLVHLILSRYRRTPRVVLKDILQWDPGVDLVLNRLSGIFLPSRSGAGDDTPARIRRMATGLGDGDALLIFPEGGNWTPARQRRAVRRLWRGGRRRAAARAARMPHVLPPRPAGTAAVLEARPDLDVIVVAHAGLDRLTSAASIWRALPVRTPMHIRWWRVPAADVPRDEEAVADWLNDQWLDVNRWVTTVHGGGEAA
jgi:1-acyl-sn-glycerol-3-phosphate acyltransferase